MYKIDELKTVSAIKNYVIKAMQEKKFGQLEIKEYEREIKYADFYTMKQISEEYLMMLNNLSQEPECTVSYLR